MLANTFIPDPIPIVDEIVMAGGFVIHFFRTIRIMEFIAAHKFLSFLLLIAIIALLIWGVPAIIGLFS
jgi:hypothetical protein